MDQGVFQFTSNTTTASSETVGTFTADAGFDHIRAFKRRRCSDRHSGRWRVSHGTNRSTLLFEANGLGSSATGGTKFLFTSSPAASLIGGGGAAGSTTISVLPFAVGSANALTPAVTWGLVTYDANGEVRPLAAAEYVTAGLSGAAAGTNVRDTFATGGA